MVDGPRVVNPVPVPIRTYSPSDQVVPGPTPPPGAAPAVPRGTLIPIRSEKQSMDWSLALASQNIVCAIRPPRDGMGWALEVDPADAGAALRTLRQYHLENRSWREAFAPADGAMAFHWAALPWCLLLLIVDYAARAPGSRLGLMGSFQTRATAAGEWWRPLTATFLHSGPDHLAANLATGFVLLGLAMGRFGGGAALLATLLAGVGGNLLAWLGRGTDYTGLGSSGVVMGALGMLTVSMVTDGRAHRLAPASVMRGFMGGTALFILLGTSPDSDVLAHAGGFLCGAILAVMLGLLPARITSGRGFGLGTGAAYFAAGAVGWLAALR